MTQTDQPMRDAEEMARRQMAAGQRAAGDAQAWGERAAEGLDRVFNGQFVEAQSEVVNLFVRTMSEQAKQNADLALDLMGTRGPDRLMQGQKDYWSETMARAQRFQNDLIAITQQMAGGQRNDRR